MITLFYICVTLGLVIIKTSVLPSVPPLKNLYDLLIPVIIYISFFRAAWEGVPIVLFCGFIMDSLGGGPMGIYTMTYVWLYAGYRWGAGFLYTSSITVVAGTVALGVVFEIVILLSYIAVLSPITGIPVDAAKTAAIQILWALITGPVIFFIVGFMEKRLERWRGKLFLGL